MFFLSNNENFFCKLLPDEQELAIIDEFVSDQSKFDNKYFAPHFPQSKENNSGAFSAENFQLQGPSVQNNIFNENFLNENFLLTNDSEVELKHAPNEINEKKIYIQSDSVVDSVITPNYSSNFQSYESTDYVEHIINSEIVQAHTPHEATVDIDIKKNSLIVSAPLTPNATSFSKHSESSDKFKHRPTRYYQNPIKESVLKPSILKLQSKFSPNDLIVDDMQSQRCSFSDSTLTCNSDNYFQLKDSTIRDKHFIKNKFIKDLHKQCNLKPSQTITDINQLVNKESFPDQTLAHNYCTSNYFPHIVSEVEDKNKLDVITNYSPVIENNFQKDKFVKNTLRPIHSFPKKYLNNEASRINNLIKNAQDTLTHKKYIVDKSSIIKKTNADSILPNHSHNEPILGNSNSVEERAQEPNLNENDELTTNQSVQLNVESVTKGSQELDTKVIDKSAIHEIITDNVNINCLPSKKPKSKFFTSMESTFQNQRETQTNKYNLRRKSPLLMSEEALILKNLEMCIQELAKKPTRNKVKPMLLNPLLTEEHNYCIPIHENSPLGEITNMDSRKKDCNIKGATETLPISQSHIQFKVSPNQNTNKKKKNNLSLLKVTNSKCNGENSNLVRALDLGKEIFFKGDSFRPGPKNTGKTKELKELLLAKQEENDATNFNSNKDLWKQFPVLSSLKTPIKDNPKAKAKKVKKNLLQANVENCIRNVDKTTPVTVGKKKLKIKIVNLPLNMLKDKEETEEMHDLSAAEWEIKCDTNSYANKEFEKKHSATECLIRPPIKMKVIRKKKESIDIIPASHINSTTKEKIRSAVKTRDKKETSNDIKNLFAAKSLIKRKKKEDQSNSIMDMKTNSSGLCDSYADSTSLDNKIVKRKRYVSINAANCQACNMIKKNIETPVHKYCKTRKLDNFDLVDGKFIISKQQLKKVAQTECFSTRKASLRSAQNAFKNEKQDVNYRHKGPTQERQEVAVKEKCRSEKSEITKQKYIRKETTFIEHQGFVNKKKEKYTVKTKCSVSDGNTKTKETSKYKCSKKKYKSMEKNKDFLKMDKVITRATHLSNRPNRKCKEVSNIGLSMSTVAKLKCYEKIHNADSRNSHTSANDFAAVNHELSKSVSISSHSPNSQSGNFYRHTNRKEKVKYKCTKRGLGTNFENESAISYKRVCISLSSNNDKCSGKTASDRSNAKYHFRESKLLNVYAEFSDELNGESLTTEDIYYLRGNSYMCSFCNYLSSQRSSMVTHARRHMDEKPYKCEFCDYASVERSHVVRHTKTHTGERTHCCKHCDYTCIQKISLNAHLKCHH